MTYACIFQSGNSRAIRLPKELHPKIGQLDILRRADGWILGKNIQQEFVRVPGLQVENRVSAND